MPSETDVDALVTELMALPPVKWEAFVDTHPVDWVEIHHAIERRIVYLARLDGYIGARGGDGQGDGGHVMAVKDSNYMAGKIRKALGYTFPRDDIYF